MKKTQKLTILFGIMLLVVTFVSVSLAWYQAIENSNMAKDLASEGITITFDKKSEMLKPDILVEGVYNGSLPEPMLDSYYVSRCNTIYVSEIVKLAIVDSELSNFKDSTLDFNIKLRYQNAVNEVEELDLSEETCKEYFNISAYLSDTEVDFSSLNSEDLIELTELTKENLAGTHYLVLAISYAKPDELLPVDLVNSPSITLNITATLN